MGGVAKEDANPGAILPFVVRVLGLKWSGEDVDRAAKRVEGGQVGIDEGAGEAGEWGTRKGGASNGAAGLERRGEGGGKAVAKVGVVLESGRPEGGVNGLGPAVSGVEECSAGLSGDVFNAIFSAAVLVMGVDAAEGEGLVRGSDGGVKSGGVEEPVVGMVVSDGDAVRGAETLKGLFGLNGSRLVEFGHEVNIGEVRKMVHEHGGSGVSSGGRRAAMGGNKTGSRAD